MLSDRFRAAVEQGHLHEAAGLFSEDATFRSPVLFKPYEGRDQVVKVLQAAERVLIDKALETRGYVLSPLAAPHHRRDGLVFRWPSLRASNRGPLPAAVEAPPT